MYELITEELGEIGTLITFSKSEYIRRNPKNIVVFNSNIIINNEKYWYGDIDISLNKHKLINLSKIFNETIYILYEKDCRYETEHNPNINNYVIKFEPNGDYKLHNRLKEYYTI